MKIVFSLFILFFSFCLGAQDLKSDSTHHKYKGRIRIGINFSPDYCYRTLKTKDTASWVRSTINDRNRTEIWCVGYTAGLSVGYTINKNLSFETGLQIANQRYQTINVGILWNVPPLGQPSSALFVYNHYYAEIPLKVSVSVGSKKFRFNIAAGVSPGFFLHYTNAYDVFDANGNYLRQTTTKFYSGFNKINLSLLANMGFTYNWNSRSGMSLEPTYRYGIIKIKNAPVHEYLWSMGVNLGYHILL